MIAQKILAFVLDRTERRMLNFDEFSLVGDCIDDIALHTNLDLPGRRSIELFELPVQIRFHLGFDSEIPNCEESMQLEPTSFDCLSTTLKSIDDRHDGIDF